VYNLGSGEVIGLKALAELMVNLGKRMNLDCRYKLVPYPSERKAIDIGDYYGDFSKIRVELGWSPRTALEAGLQATLAYYVANRAHYWETAGSDRRA
jgi:dTDP-glucose 4,6-dehydratase/UDP-glucose 4-epimerase